MTYVIRTAGVDDAAAIAALVNDAFAMEREFVDRDRTSADEIVHLLGTGTFLAIDGDPGLSACVYFEPRGARLYLGMLAVSPSHQKHGLGKQLMMAGERFCLEHGCTGIDIRIVNRRTELPPFYRRLGFVEQGTEPFDDPLLTKPCHFIRMSKDLPADRP